MNRLSKETSPYLIQHANNPVDWYPWGKEAFETARTTDKPIFLSIGYSTCHWCHVMAHDSFEDERVAELLNKAFVNIKVDREERPDIDDIYMKVCQIMTGSGGWPLTIIMTPEGKPFFAATFIPKESSYGRMGMLDLIPAVEKAWKNQREELTRGAESVAEALKRPPSSASAIPDNLSAQIVETLRNQYDKTYGGFGTAPKFPSPHNLLFLLRDWKSNKEQQNLNMVANTLTKMRNGGIYDQLGYGFHRYSVDAEWLVPHFEKMLYDQAMHMMAYSEAYAITKDEYFSQTVNEIYQYITRDLYSASGAFYSAENADSEGIEGKFYVWSTQELDEVLGDYSTEGKKLFNLDDDGNYHDEATHRKTGENILYLKQELSKTKENNQKIIRDKLFNDREKRIRPSLDNKILTDWNALMIVGLSKAAKFLNDEKFSDTAIKAAGFILKNMHKNGQLKHYYGQKEYSAYLDDYAFMTWALLELYSITFDAKYLEHARTIADSMKKQFQDKKNGGFYMTSEHGEKLLARSKNAYDGAIPSGNSIAMLALLKLSRILGDTTYEKDALETARAFSEDISRAPQAFSMMAGVIASAKGKSHEIVISVNAVNDETEKILEELKQTYLPNTNIILRTDENAQKLAELAPYTKEQEPMNGKPTAYICTERQCLPPTTDLSGIIMSLSE